MAASAAAVKRTGLSCPGHTRPIVDLAFVNSADGPLLLSGAKDQTPMIRNGSTGDWIGTLEGHKGSVWGVAFDGKGTRAATASADFSVKLWSAQTGDELLSLAHPHVAKAVSFSPDEARLATACQDKLLRVYDLGQAGASEPVLKLAGHSGGPKRVLYLSDTTLVSGGDDKAVKVWDARSGALVATHAVPEAITSMDVCLTRNVLLVTHGSAITQYDLRSWEATLASVPGGANAAAVHPSEPLAVWGGNDGLVRIGAFPAFEVTEECRGHFGPVHTLRISPDGEVIASGSEDGTIRLWQVHVGREYGLWRAADEPAPAQ